MFFQVAGVLVTSVHFVHNERTKLTATWFNGLAAALVAAGGFAPLAALLYGFSDLRLEKAYIFVLAALCGIGGLTLHWMGRRFLGRLRE